MLLAAPAITQTPQAKSTEPASPYGGVTVEEILARVNDQIITRGDYDRAMKELDDEARQRGATMQQMSEAHKDLLRNLIDQQLWLSKGKELGINGDTELVNRLNEIRKQYNLATMEDLEKAAQEQGVSFEDFKANIRNQIITQEVMRDEVGAHISRTVTPGEVQRYFEEHKQDFVQPESVKLSEILISTGTGDADDAKVAAAKAKADDIEAKLKTGADFTQLARTSSDGQTASEGGDLGQYKRGALAKALEDATFGLQAGQYTEPIRTRQGYIILKVNEHVGGSAPQFKDVQNQVEEAYYMSKMEPAMRDYLTKMREDAYINIKPGYEDTGATTNKRINPIAYSAYTPPAAKKKKKVERTRFRENAHFRQKGPQVVDTAATTTAPAPTPATATTNTKAQKAGKKEKIRFGKAPTKTLPAASAPAQTEDAAGANGATAAEAAGGTQTAQNQEPDNPLEQAAPQKKTRFSERAKLPKEQKSKNVQEQQKDATTPAPAGADELADRQTQSQPLGLGGDTASKKKKKNTATTEGEKTRYSQRKPDETQKNAPAPQPTPIPQVQGAGAPQAAPANAPAPAPAPTQAPAQPQTTAPQQ